MVPEEFAVADDAGEGFDADDVAAGVVEVADGVAVPAGVVVAVVVDEADALDPGTAVGEEFGVPAVAPTSTTSVVAGTGTAGAIVRSTENVGDHCVPFAP